jgi:hypothetical protein
MNVQITSEIKFSSGNNIKKNNSFTYTETVRGSYADHFYWAPSLQDFKKYGVKGIGEFWQPATQEIAERIYAAEINKQATIHIGSANSVQESILCRAKGTPHPQHRTCTTKINGDQSEPTETCTSTEFSVIVRKIEFDID